MLYNLYLRQEFSMQSCTPTITLCKHNPGVMNLGQIWYNSHHLDTKLTLNCALNFVCESDTIRGWPFDSEGGGGLANLVGIDYLFSTWAWPENLFSGITKARIFIIISNKILEKQKKKAKKKNEGGRGWNVGSEGRQDRIFQVIFFLYFCRLPVCACSVCKWSGCMLDFDLIMYTKSTL